MPTLSITPANVVAASTAATGSGMSGDAIEQGLAIYRDTPTNTYKIADTTTATKAKVAGIALTNSHPGQPVCFCLGGDLELGAILEAGVFYYLANPIPPSTSTGQIASLNDVWWEGICGTSNSTTNFDVASSTPSMANDDDVNVKLPGLPIVFYDVSNSNTPSVRYITTATDDPVGNITINAAPSFTRQDGVDRFKILGVPILGGDSRFLTLLGVETTTSNLRVGIVPSGIAQA